MNRCTDALSAQTFDLLIIGAGVYGAALALQASECGYSVAIIERNDFASGASSNSLKILHGGLRYLQQFDLMRMRSSIRARREWSQLAPDFVSPLPCAIGTRGFGKRSAGALAAALAVNEIVSMDRNRGLSDRVKLPTARMLSREQYAAMVRGLIAPEGGGALWWDALALDSERLVMELLMRAVDQGAQIANYVEADTLIVRDKVVAGVVARDVESDQELRINARRVVCTGDALTADPQSTVPALRSHALRPRCHAFNVVVDRSLPTDTALALPPRATAGGPALSRGDLFFVPWRGRTLIGTHYIEDAGQEIAAHRPGSAVEEFMSLIRSAAPQWDLAASEVTFVHCGRLALVDDWRPGTPLRLATATEVIDGGHVGTRNLWMVSGPKFTTALEVARTALPRILKGIRPSIVARRSMAPCEGLRALDAERDLTARARIAVTRLHARRLADVVLRRGGPGSSGYPGYPTLEASSRGMAAELGWSPQRVAAEIAALQQLYRDRHAWHPAGSDAAMHDDAMPVAASAAVAQRPRSA